MEFLRYLAGRTTQSGSRLSDFIFDGGGSTADWLIEGNRFFHNQHAAMLLAPDVGPNWSEGFGARNIVIRNNQFELANCMGGEDGTVIGLGAYSNGDASHYPILENILFENNVFQEMTGLGFDIKSFKNLVIRNNRFINHEPAPVVLKLRGSIQAEFGNSLSIEGNLWTTGKGFPAPSLLYDSQTATKIICQDNQLKD